MQKPKVIVICGPTAIGKTALSIELAKKINGEIISADSMQIYKDMDIGTAKPDQEEMQGIKHYLLDFVNPDTRYSVAEFKQDATNAIEEILQKGKTPIIVGGTGLYVDTLIYGIEYNDIEIDEEYRNNGYGYQLITNVLSQLFTNYDTVHLHVTKENEPAVLLYRKCGFDIQESVEIFEL